MDFRNEWKYICDEQTLQILQKRLDHVMTKDPHCKDGPGYSIRSVYFDDYDNTGMMENEGGIDNRKKFRIRIYNCSEDRIRLEIKYKLRGYTKKESCFISKELCDQILRGEKIAYDKTYAPPLQQLYVAMNCRLLHPVVIVEYERIPYVDNRGNVRITLDRNIGGSNNVTRLFDPMLPVCPAQRAGEHILEVKFDEILPEFYQNLWRDLNLQRVAFSKYYMCQIQMMKGRV